ncbi:hypothetical protein JYT28_00465 [Desulfobulbus sp. AH-315-M07]|nr:hypothetical protein [Desulfobulbus sp. AH-315-M07]
MRWLGIALLCCCLSCGASPSSWVRVQNAQIKTAGMVIEAEDGSSSWSAAWFRLVTGEPFQTPFWAYDCPGRATTANFHLGEKLGAKRVRVHHPRVDQPLHGLLAFCWIHPEVQGPVARLYLLRVPDSYVAETSGGRISVVYEPQGHKIDYDDGERDVPAWILWLSRRPFPRAAAEAP